MRDFMLMINEETKFAWRATGTIALKTGNSGFKEHFGKEFWAWHSGMGRERQMAQFDGAMKGFSSEISGSLLVDWAPPAKDATVCDIGGGMGHMLIALAEHWPQTTGVVFDLPPVAARAKANIESAGFAARLRTIGGSFMDELPAELAKCDVFYLKFILHDWGDADCIRILKRITAVAKAGAQIVSTDFILGTDGANMEMSKRMMDVNMMASNPPGASERTWESYAALFRAAGVPGTPALIKMRDLVSTVQVTL